MENELKLEDLKTTIVISYEEAMTMMTYSSDFCGCCQMRTYNEWYDGNVAYFVKKGVFVVDDLLHDDSNNNPKMRYSVLFSFENPLEAMFTVVSYYTQEVIAKFRYIRENNKAVEGSGSLIPKITTDYLNIEAFHKFGYFMNEPTSEATGTNVANFQRRYKGIPKKKYAELLQREKIHNARFVSNFMWAHTVEMIHSMMFYFTLEKPSKLPYENFVGQQKETIAIEMVDFTSGKKVKYYYTGYVNLSKTKVYKAKINEGLERKKRGEYERHIEKWGVRGHYRNLPNGDKIWIDAFTKGEGRLENRIYGTKDEKDMLLIPKVFEVERRVRVEANPSEEQETILLEPQEAQVVAEVAEPTSDTDAEMPNEIPIVTVTAQSEAEQPKEEQPKEELLEEPPKQVPLPNKEKKRWRIFTAINSIFKWIANKIK